MRKTLTTATILGLLATPAFAWDYNQTGGHNNQQIGDSATGYQFNTSQHQSQKQAQKQGQTQNATGGAGGSVSVVNSAGGAGGGGTGPTLYIPNGSGEAGCGGGIGGGGGVGSAAAGLGGTLWEFGDCKRMREVDALRKMAIENKDSPAGKLIEQAALNELCQIDRIKDAFGGKCPTLYPISVYETGVVVRPLEPQLGYVGHCHNLDSDGFCKPFVAIHKSKPKPIVKKAGPCPTGTIEACVPARGGFP